MRQAGEELEELREATRRQTLLGSLLDGMHSIAQPLTYLQAFFHLQLQDSSAIRNPHEAVPNAQEAWQGL